MLRGRRPAQGNKHITMGKGVENYTRNISETPDSDPFINGRLPGRIPRVEKRSSITVDKTQNSQEVRHRDYREKIKMDQLFGSESGLVYENSRPRRNTMTDLSENKGSNGVSKSGSVKKKLLRLFFSKKTKTSEEGSKIYPKNFSHIYFTCTLQKTLTTCKLLSQLSFIGKDCHKIPPIIPNRFGSKVNTLDLSFNSLTTLQGVESFIFLKELILDNNILSDNIVIPKMELLETLSINKNKIINLELFLQKVQSNLPSLKYLSLLGNVACPNQLSDCSKDEEDYKRYRYYVINQLPNLQFLDSTPVTVEEKTEAKRRGHLMKIAKPLNKNPIEDGYLSSPCEYTPLPKTGREMNDHQGAYGKCKYRYSGKHSEGNRFIQNNDL